MGTGLNMLTAHSGSDGYPDNSLVFIQAILVSHVDAFEVDVQIESTGKLYLSHDSLADWSQAISLKTCYHLLSTNPQMILNVDCKNKKVGPLALNMARDMGLSNQVVLSGSLPLNQFDPDERPKLFYNLENYFTHDTLNFTKYEGDFDWLVNQGIQVVQVHYKLVNPHLLNFLSQFGLKLSVWTVDQIEEIEKLYQMGVYNVTSRIALEYLKEGENHDRN